VVRQRAAACERTDDKVADAMLSALASAAENNTTAAYYAGFNLTGSADSVSGGPVFPNYIRTTTMIFCIVILGIGVVGNVMVPIVILKSKDMRNSTNIFLMNLSVADLMVLLVCTPTVLVEVNSPPEVWVLGEEMCEYHPLLLFPSRSITSCFSAFDELFSLARCPCPFRRPGTQGEMLFSL
jgi:7 transmembrane receptor (rhodopsin family)